MGAHLTKDHLHSPVISRANYIAEAQELIYITFAEAEDQRKSPCLDDIRMHLPASSCSESAHSTNSLL